MKTFRNPLHFVLSSLSLILLTEGAALNSPLNLPTLSSDAPRFSSDAALNSTYLGAIDETKFRTDINYGTSTLPATSILMNAVDAMVQLALQDFESQMTRKSFVLEIPRYSNVEIIISPWDEAPGATLQTGYAVLGLYQVMFSTLREPIRRFKTVESTLVYNEVNVGRLWILRRAELASSPVLDNSSLTLTTSSNTGKSLNDTEDLVVTANTTSLPTASWNDPHLRVTIVHGLAVFTVYELFFVVLTFMKVEAVKPRTSRVRGFTLTVAGPPIITAGQPITTAFKELGNPPRTPANPPYL